MSRDLAGSALTLLLIAAAAALVAGQLLGQPVLLGFVTTDSMQPTLDPGDGFIAVPAAVSGDVEPGDVVVFEAEELHGGGLVTHRVVDETEAGYVTKGDANPFTDQDGDEPPVTEDRIVATALRVDGEVVVVPHLGTAITFVRDAFRPVSRAVDGLLGVEGGSGVRTLGPALFGLGALLFAATALRRSGKGSRDRSRSRDREAVVDGRVVAAVVIVLVLLPANAAMLAPVTAHQVTVDGDELAGDAGETATAEITARNDGVVSMLVVLEAADPAAETAPSVLELPPGETTTATLSAPTPPPGEARTVRVAERRYFTLLPTPVLLSLHDASPLLAVAAIDVLLVTGVLGVVGGALGIRRLRLRNTGRDLPLRRRVREFFR